MFACPLLKKNIHVYDTRQIYLYVPKDKGKIKIRGYVVENHWTIQVCKSCFYEFPRLNNYSIPINCLKGRMTHYILQDIMAPWVLMPQIPAIFNRPPWVTRFLLLNNRRIACNTLLVALSVAGLTALIAIRSISIGTDLYHEVNWYSIISFATEWKKLAIKCMLVWNASEQWNPERVDFDLHHCHDCRQDGLSFWQRWNRGNCRFSVCKIHNLRYIWSQLSWLIDKRNLF